MASPETLDRLARASVDEGCRALRLEGTESIRRAKAWFSGPVLGLVKRAYPDSEVYITPTLAEVEALLAAGVEVIAADATPRPRPNAERLEDLIAAAHRGGALVMADIDSEESARFALKAGADILSTTLSGYTSRKTSGNGPDLALIREIRRFFSGPLLAEGRYQEPWQAKAALGVGADGVVIGGALNDPNKQTRRFLSALLPRAERVGAVDLGGTWLRFGVFDSDLRPVEGSHRRQPLPATRAERLDWIEQQARSAGVDRLGISSGGTLDPHDQGHVWEAKDFIPDHRGTRFVWPGLEAVALNDGLANAWGLSHTPVAAGRRVVGLALGTGVGAGLVSEGRLHMGPRG
ncbi:MAG: putative N-acetylmannosamine-6-phosphate 2-epimerase, partial [Fimbriimonadaceae bacterium]|nr:putative N-acetylmannosamine-6-phosphate 2-epimerase [Fimbriimonadaceae bacterium]